MRLRMANVAVAVLVAAVVLSMGLQPARGETREELQEQIETLSQEIKDLRASLERIERDLSYLRVDGHLPGGYLGAVFSTIPGEKGVLLEDVVVGSPGHIRGLCKGDVILSYDSHPTHTREVLLSLLKGTRPGTMVDITVFKVGEVKMFWLVVGTKPRR